MKNKDYHTSGSHETRLISWPRGTGMVYLGMSPWDGMWKNRQQLMSRFARQLPVLYVEPPLRLRRLRRQSPFSRSFYDGFRKARTRAVAPGMHVFQSPSYLPVSDSRWLSTATRARWLDAVRAAAQAVGIESPILWLSLPEQHYTIGRFGEVLSIYHVVDEYSGYTSDNEERRARMQRYEQILLDQVDLTIVVSPELHESKSAADREIHLVENAVDIGLYRQAAHTVDVPDDIARIPAPRLGYSGLIGKRLDLDLLRRIAESRRHWSIVLLGRLDERDCEDALRALRAQENVHLLGEKSPAEVASYVAAFDVGLLPYTLNTETIHISPLKLYEYLAAGLPIVGTAIPAAKRKAEFVRVAADAGQFIDHCEQAVGDVDESLAARRINEAERNSWEHRVSQIVDLIRPRLDRGHGTDAGRGMPLMAGR